MLFVDGIAVVILALAKRQQSSCRLSRVRQKLLIVVESGIRNGRIKCLLLCCRSGFSCFSPTFCLVLALSYHLHQVIIEVALFHVRSVVLMNCGDSFSSSSQPLRYATVLLVNSGSCRNAVCDQCAALALYQFLTGIFRRTESSRLEPVKVRSFPLRWVRHLVEQCP